MICNVHARTLACSPEQAWGLLEQIPGTDSRIWPVDDWPPMVLDRPLGVGADGGHGPIRYTCTAYEPGHRVEFSFGPGFMRPGATHTFSVREGPMPGTCVLRHELLGRPTRVGRLIWVAMIGPFHDAVLEELFDRAQIAIDDPPTQPARRPRWVRFTRPLAERIFPS